MKKNISTAVMNTASSVDGTAVQLQSATPRYQAVVGLDVRDRQSLWLSRSRSALTAHLHR